MPVHQSSTSARYRSHSQLRDHVGQPACRFDRRPCRPNSSRAALFSPFSIFLSGGAVPSRAVHVTGDPVETENSDEERWSRKTPGFCGSLFNMSPATRTQSQVTHLTNALAHKQTYRHVGKQTPRCPHMTGLRSCVVLLCVKNPLSSFMSSCVAHWRR